MTKNIISLFSPCYFCNISYSFHCSDQFWTYVIIWSLQRFGFLNLIFSRFKYLKYGLFVMPILCCLFSFGFDAYSWWPGSLIHNWRFTSVQHIKQWLTLLFYVLLTIVYTAHCFCVATRHFVPTSDDPLEFAPATTDTEFFWQNT